MIPSHASVACLVEMLLGLSLTCAMVEAVWVDREVAVVGPSVEWPKLGAIGFSLAFGTGM